MLKPKPTKQEIRQQLMEEVQEFLDNGGEVKEVEKGCSGDNPVNPWNIPLQFEPAQQERHPVGELVRRIDARKKKKRESPAPRSKKPRKHWIYDDFGEPVRWVWK